VNYVVAYSTKILGGPWPSRPTVQRPHGTRSAGGHSNVGLISPGGNIVVRIVPRPSGLGRNICIRQRPHLQRTYTSSGPIRRSGRTRGLREMQRICAVAVAVACDIDIGALMAVQRVTYIVIWNGNRVVY